MAPLRALPGVAKVYFYMISCFLCFRKMIFLWEINFFVKKWKFLRKSEENHQNRDFDMVTGVNWILEVNFHKFHEFCHISLISIKIANFTENALFRKFPEFLTFSKFYRFGDPPEGEILAYQVKVMALGAEMDEIHKISLKWRILRN